MPHDWRKTSERQHAAITRPQMLRSMTRGEVQGQLDRGVIVSRHPGVYVMAGTPPTHEQALMAAVLAAGDGAVASHSAAVKLWVPSMRIAPEIEVTVPFGGNARLGGEVIVHRSRHLGPEESSRRDGIPVTCPLRTVVDAASFLPREAFEVLYEELRHRRLISNARVKGHIAKVKGRGRAGTVLLRDMISVLAGRAAAESAAETLAIKSLREAGFDPPDRQVRIKLPSGRVIRADIAWLNLLFRLEIDGRADHGTYSATERDKATDIELRILGWDTMRVAPSFVRDRTTEFVAAVRAALTRNAPAVRR